jgi:PAS domain-containing protein
LIDARVFDLKPGTKGSSDVAQGYAVRLMQHLVVPTFVLNPKRRVVIWNRACERLTGVAAADVIGTSDHWRAFYAAGPQAQGAQISLTHFSASV